MTALPHMKRPCSECPWRVDAELGRFPPERYEHLTATAGAPGNEAGLDAPMFACHKTGEGREVACAGWLAVAGIEHLGVRLALSMGRLEPGVLQQGDDWPELYASYEEMAAVNDCTSQANETQTKGRSSPHRQRNGTKAT